MGLSCHFRRTTVHDPRSSHRHQHPPHLFEVQILITTLEYLLIVTELLSKRFISRLKFVDTVVFLPECCLEFVDAVVDAELAGTGDRVVFDLAMADVSAEILERGRNTFFGRFKSTVSGEPVCCWIVISGRSIIWKNIHPSRGYKQHSQIFAGVVIGGPVTTPHEVLQLAGLAV